jgi:hypothetical protein
MEQSLVLQTDDFLVFPVKLVTHMMGSGGVVGVLLSVTWLSRNAPLANDEDSSYRQRGVALKRSHKGHALVNPAKSTRWNNSLVSACL